MNLKIINKLFICFLLLFLFSCESSSGVKKINDKNIKIKNTKEVKTKIILNTNVFNEDIEDFYSSVNLKNFNNKNEFSKLHTFNTKRKKTQNSKNLISFIYQNQFIFLDLKSNLNIYDLKNFNLIKSIDLKNYIDNYDSYVTSIARIKNNFYVSYSEGLVLNFNLQGQLIWSRDLKKIIKTPIKIYNNNLIILAGSDIISIEPSTGEINLEFSYGSNNIFQANGGDVIILNHLLFFILPNGKLGEINMIFKEKNKSVFSKFDFKSSINHSSDKLYSFNNTLSYFNQKNYLYSFDIGKNEILLNSEKINNVYSFKFYNNSIFLLDKNNLLKSLNTHNGNIFWEIDLSNYIYKDDKIIHISTLSDSLIVFFESGNIIEFNHLNGNIIANQKLKIDSISHLLFNNHYLILYHDNDKVTLLTQ